MIEKIGQLVNLDNIGKSTNVTPAKGGPQGKGGVGSGTTGGPSSNVKRLQETYRGSAELIRTMQRLLGQVGNQINLLAVREREAAGKDPNKLKGIQEKEKLGLQIIGTQAGSNFQDSEDGVWGKNTAKALEAAKKYIVVAKLKIGAQLLTMAPNGLPEATMKDENKVREIVQENNTVLAQMLRGLGDVSGIGGDATVELDKLPPDWQKCVNDTNEFAGDGGGVTILTGHLFNLIAMYKVLSSSGIVPETTNKPGQGSDLLEKTVSETGNATSFSADKITGADIVGWFSSKGLIARESDLVASAYKQFINATQQLLTNNRLTEESRNNAMRLFNKVIANAFGYDNHGFKGADIKGDIFTNSSQSAGIAKQDLDKFIAHVDQQIKLLADKLKKGGYNPAELSVLHITPPQVFLKEYADKLAETWKQNPQGIPNDPELIAFFGNRQRGPVSSGNSWTFEQFKLATDMFIKRSGIQMEASATEPTKAALKKKYNELARGLAEHLNRLRARIAKLVQSKGIAPSESLLTNMKIPLEYLQQEYGVDAEGRRVGGKGGRGGHGNQGGPGAGSGGGFGGAGGEYGESGKAMGPPNWKTSTPVTIGNTYAIHLRTLGRWSSLGGGLGAENIPGAEQMPSLNYGLFSTGDPPIIVEQLINVFGNKKDAAAYLKSIQSMLRTAMTGWVRVGQHLLDDGKISESQMNETMSQVSQRVGAWHKALSGAAAMIYNSRI